MPRSGAGEIRSLSASGSRARDAWGITVTNVRAELEALGLAPPMCSHIKPDGKRCSQEAMSESTKCIYHGGVEVQVAKVVAAQREQMMQTLLPVAIRRLEGVLLDPEAKEEVVVRAAFGLMDRVGLGPVAGLTIDAKVEMGQTPSELLLASLAKIAERLQTQDATEKALSSGLQDEDIVDGEVVGEEDESA